MMKPIYRLRAAPLGLCLAAALHAQTLENLVHAYQKNPKPQTRAAVLRFADAHRNDEQGALALLAAGASEIDQRQFGDAAEHLRSAGKRLPKLADYAGYLSGAAQFELREFSAVESALKPVWEQAPASPLAGKAALLEGNAYLQESKAAQAIGVLRARYADIPEAQALDLLGHAYENAGDAAKAAASFERVYLEFPLSKEASDAEAALARYAKPSAGDLLKRAFRWLDGGDYTRGRRELEPLVARLGGAEQELAQVRIGAARYLGRDPAAAYTFLSGLHPAAPEAAAERLYYMLQCARRLDKVDDMDGALEQLSRAYPKSPWRLKALVAAAGFYNVRNETSRYQPLYRACYESFSSEPEAPECHWKVTWAQYLREAAAAEPMLREHLKRYPSSDKATAAMYFLGRIAESKGDASGARTYYDALVEQSPNYYYAIVARERLKAPAVARSAASPEVRQWLTASAAPASRLRADGPEASAAAAARIERARLLAAAGLDDLAESELRFGAKNGAQTQTIAVELAELANRRDAPDQAIRYIKRYAPGYLQLPVNSGSERLWKLAFPLPYRPFLEEYSREHALDPYLVAGLIRQESEFNTRAVSRANAYGLTQVLPSTGRELSRRLNVRNFRSSMLFEPETNIRLGTYYLRSLLDQLDGKPEPALASYNAGKSRVTAWMSWNGFREPAEFIESIPLNETRNYVQSVLRNAELYRQLYGAH